MTITQDNYESFFLDYLEGNMEENMIDQFLDFLEQNPDLKEELHLFENIRLPEEKFIFQDKQQLYKSAANEAEAFENRAIACLEGDLDDEGRKSFETYLSIHPELQAEYNLYAKTHLVPDAGIKYPDKKKLYKKTGTAILLKWTVRVAAALAIIWGINAVFQDGRYRNPKIMNPEVAENGSKPSLPAEKAEPVKIVPETAVQEKREIASVGTSKGEAIQEQSQEKPEETRLTKSAPDEKDLVALSGISPIRAQLNAGPVENQLAVAYSAGSREVNESVKIMALEEFVASRAKRAGNAGLLSAQRIVRAGLDVASELSGERIGYSMKDGKIASVGFESKLMAFSIPLTKK